MNFGLDLIKDKIEFFEALSLEELEKRSVSRLKTTRRFC